MRGASLGSEMTSETTAKKLTADPYGMTNKGTGNNKKGTGNKQITGTAKTTGRAF
jgi:hypothetical protein